MRLVLIPLAFAALTACGPAGAQIGDDTAVDTAVTGDADTDADTDSDTDADADADADSDADADADTDADTDADPIGDDTWTGWRDFSFPDTDWSDGCEERVEEQGVEVTLDPGHADALAACPECDQIFLIEMSTDRICDGFVEIGTPVVRGIEWTESGAVLYRVDYHWQGNGSWESSVMAERVEVADDGLYYHYTGALQDLIEYEVSGYAKID